MSKENLDGMFDLIDSIFNSINEKQKATGTGLNFWYQLTVDPPTKDKGSIYNISIFLKEVGHGERILQTFSYNKPDSLDVYTMKYQVFASLLTIFTESTLFHWNELGKLLNTDADLQQAALDTKK